MTDNDPMGDDAIEEIASILNFDEADTDKLRLSVMETHEKANTMLEAVKEIGHNFSVKVGEETYVNVAWLGTMMLMEADQIVRGHGGCPDHMRVIDLIQTSMLAALKNVEE